MAHQIKIQLSSSHVQEWTSLTKAHTDWKWLGWKCYCKRKKRTSNTQIWQSRFQDKTSGKSQRTIYEEEMVRWTLVHAISNSTLGYTGKGESVYSNSGWLWYPTLIKREIVQTKRNSKETSRLICIIEQTHLTNISTERSWNPLQNRSHFRPYNKS